MHDTSANIKREWAIPLLMSVRMESPVLDMSTRHGSRHCPSTVMDRIAGAITPLKRFSYWGAKLIATNTNGWSSMRQNVFKYVCGYMLATNILSLPDYFIITILVCMSAKAP
jgi:hypothetical protein